MKRAWWGKCDARWMAVLGVLLTWIFLQVLRTRFFLTDDSFTLFYPVWVDMGRKWFEGGDPWTCQWLFGGDYPWMRDSVFLPLLHPFCLLVSLLAITPFQTWMVDVVCLFHLVVAVWGFEEMLERLRGRGWAAVGRSGGLFLGWSYAFSMYALLLGSSGFWYLANLSALPWMVVGLLEKRAWRAVWILGLSVFQGLVGGHPSCFLYSVSGLLLLAGWLAWHERALNRLLRNLAGVAWGGLLALPLVWTPLSALGESVRSGAIPLELASEGRLPWGVALGSVFLSSGSVLFGRYELFGQAAHAYAIVSFAAAGLFALAWVRRPSDWGVWDGVLIAGLLAGLLLITRPDWLGQWIGEVPLFRSLRWPHKEVVLVLFVMHLFAARGTALSIKWVRLAGFASACIFISPLIAVGLPTFNEHALSRRMVFDGTAEKAAYFVKAQMQPGQQVVASLPGEYLPHAPTNPAVPWVALLSYNFPALWKIPGWAGYSATLPRRIYEVRKPFLADVYGNIRSQDEVGLMEAQPQVVVLHWDPDSPHEMELRAMDHPSFHKEPPSQLKAKILGIIYPINGK